MTRCLGRLVAPLADGSLPPSEREKALVHVAACPSCRTALDDERSVRSLLSAVGAPEVPAGLLMSLSGIPAGPVAPPTPGLVPPPPLSSVTGPAPRRDSLLRRPGGVVMGAAVAAAASAGLAVLAGAPQAATSVPVVVPDGPRFAQEHRSTVGGATLGDGGLSLTSIGAPPAGGHVGPTRAGAAPRRWQPVALLPASMLAGLRAGDDVVGPRAVASAAPVAAPVPGPSAAAVPTSAPGPLAVAPVSAPSAAPTGP